MRALSLLALLASCAQGYADFGSYTDQSAAAIRHRAEIRFVATVTGHARIDGTGICPGGPGEQCDVYQLALAEPSRALRCPLIAIRYFDDNGHGYFSWNPTIMNEGVRRWSITALRVPRPYCHYTLEAASRAAG